MPDHITVGATPAGYYHRSSADESLTNSLFYNNDAAYVYDYGWETLTHNAFTNPAHSQGDSPIVDNITLKYILRQEQGSVLEGAGNDGVNIGADITQQYGASGTLWGEPGFDQRTATPLWPWNHEEKIKEIFRIPNPPPAGNVPGVNVTKRGFTVDEDPFGQPMTLTRYIWQYLGNRIPADIYGTSPGGPIQMAITANGGNGPLTVNEGSPLDIAISLTPGARIGQPADWWVAARTPFGVYWFTTWKGWTPQGTPLSAYNGPLIELSPLSVLSTSHLPPVKLMDW